MYVDLADHLRHLEEVRPDSGEVVDIRIAWHTFPDLRAYKDHLGVVRLCSSSVNYDCDQMYMVHRTDTDSGSLEILPFVFDKQVRIHSDPPIFVVGQRNPNGFGEVGLPDWRELLEDAGIGPLVISKVRQYLNRHPPINYRDVPD